MNEEIKKYKDLDPFIETPIEKVIEELPDEGDIEISFMRIYPKFKMIEKLIPLTYISKYYSGLYGELKQSGIRLTVNPSVIKIEDYYRFVKKLFKNFKVEDLQVVGNGKPDFFLSNKDVKFYIEFKSSSDFIRSSQLNWIGNNQDEEVWFMVLGKIRGSRYN